MSGSNTVIPTADDAFINWMNEHSNAWSNPTVVGLTQASYDIFKGEVSDMNAAWDEWARAKIAYKAASDNWKAKKAQVRKTGSNDVKTIRAFAARQPDPQAVLDIARIPAPKTPNFGVPPGQPTGAEVSLDVNTGNLQVRFDCNNPPGLSGTVYIVQRRIAQATAPAVFGPWNQAAVTSVKRFVDSTITAGTAAVQYLITAQRGTIVGTTSQPITVQFGRAGGAGTGGGPGLTVTVGEDGQLNPVASPRLAA